MHKLQSCQIKIKILEKYTFSEYYLKLIIQSELNIDKKYKFKI